VTDEHDDDTGMHQTIQHIATGGGVWRRVGALAVLLTGLIGFVALPHAEHYMCIALIVIGGADLGVNGIVTLRRFLTGRK